MITSLTKEQRELLPVYRDKWMRIGLSTEPCDVEKAKIAVSDAYRMAGLEPPKIWLHARCPIEAGLMVAFLRQMLDELKKHPGECPKLGASVWDSVWASVGASVRASVRDSVGDSVFGSHEAAWLGYMDYFGEVVGITDVEKLRPIMRVAESCGWWIPYRDVCVLQDRPERVLLNERGRIHCEDGPAISYRSGLLDIYAIHGVRVTKQVVMEPETLTVEQIKGEPNAEIRRIMIDRLGVGKYAEKTKAVVIDRDFVFRFPGDESPMPRVLIQLDDKSKWLLGTDGSTHRVYHMPVPNTSTTCKQAHEAISGRPDNAIQWQG